MVILCLFTITQLSSPSQSRSLLKFDESMWPFGVLFLFLRIAVSCLCFDLTIGRESETLRFESIPWHLEFPLSIDLSFSRSQSHSLAPISSVSSSSFSQAISSSSSSSSLGELISRSSSFFFFFFFLLLLLNMPFHILQFSTFAFCFERIPVSFKN